MSVKPTGFVANNSNYEIAQDLSEIFAPLVPKNYDRGTLTYYYTSLVANTWNTVFNYNTSTAAYTKTTANSAVSITSTFLNVGTTYFNFSTPGTYTLDITLGVTAYNFPVTTTYTFYHSINPTTGRLNYIDLHYGGCGATSAATVGIETNQDTNALAIFNTGSSSTSYPVLEMKVAANTTTPYYNIYNYSVTFIVPSTATESAPYQIKPELRCTSNLAQSTGASITFSGNWMATKLN